jgi:hypothetical protein
MGIKNTEFDADFDSVKKLAKSSETSYKRKYYLNFDFYFCGPKVILALLANFKAKRGRNG